MTAPRGHLPVSLELFLLAAVPRVAYLFIARPPIESVYWALSESLRQHGSLVIDNVRVTGFEPLYPIFLCISRILARDHVLGVQLFQVAMASFGAVFMYRLGNALTSRQRLAAIGAMLYAVDPLLVRQAAGPSESALVTTLLVGFAYYAVTATTVARAAWSGVWLGLAVLTRAMTLPLVLLGPAVLLANRRPRLALAMTMTALVIMLPLPLRTHAVNDSWWPTRSGVNLFIGNSPHTAALLPDEDPDLLQAEAASLVARELPRLSDLTPDQAARAEDALLTRHALDYMAERPFRTVAQKALNVLYFFSPRLVPFRTATHGARLIMGSEGEVIVEHSEARPLVEVIAHALFYSFVLVCTVVGLWLRGRAIRHDAMLWCIVATFVAVYAFYFPATRYRAPMSFVMLFYAAVALDCGVARLWRRPSPRWDVTTSFEGS